jgi:hypothetical protein
MDDIDVAAAGDLVVVVVFVQVLTISPSHETRGERGNDARARRRCRARLSDLQWSRPSLSFFLA